MCWQAYHNLVNDDTICCTMCLCQCEGAKQAAVMWWVVQGAFARYNVRSAANLTSCQFCCREFVKEGNSPYDSEVVLNLSFLMQIKKWKTSFVSETSVSTPCTKTKPTVSVRGLSPDNDNLHTELENISLRSTSHTEMTITKFLYGAVGIHCNLHG